MAMDGLLQNEKTYVSRLRVRGVRLDPLVTQLRMENLLNAASLRPAGLAPSAILCVRRLRARLSGPLQLRHAGAHSPDVWERAVRAKLDELVRRAARPSRGLIPTDADAVIFEDRAQLLACLASDWCDGTFHTRWWWHSLFKEAAIARHFLPAWLDAPEYIPSALEQLSREQKIGPFLRALSAKDALSLLQSIARVFALDSLRPALAALVNPDGDTSRDTLQITAVNSSQGQSDADSQPARLPPWQRYLPESRMTGIILEAQSLLGICLMLARSTAILRSPSFARDLEQWLKAAANAPRRVNADLSGPRANHQSVRESGVAAQVSGTSRQDQSASSSAEPEQTRDDEMESHATVHSAPETRRSSSVSEQHDALAAQWNAKAACLRDALPRETTAGNVATSESASEAQTVSADNPELRQPKEDDERLAIREQVSLASVEHDGSTSHARASVLFDEAPEEATLLEQLTEARIETELGGIFYLINVGLFLNLYGDFTMPARMGIALSIWDFLALLGERLCGKKIRADKVWPLLARLAGRKEQTEPGQDFVPPREWRLPPEWLEPFSRESVCEWTTDGARLRVRHARGFWILDLPLDASGPARQLELEMSAYSQRAAFELWRGTWPVEEFERREPVETWLSWIVAYVQARLLRALGLERANALSKLLCEHTARVFVTATHLDIVFKLDQLPVEVRLSGLDRNPGWVPAAGRFIAFHYD